jgi:glyoxylase-like metal-dependent hydrolase (beta-lactamase superfamily II)
LTVAGAREVARGVYLLPGRFVPGTQPDGNTVIFRAPEGLIVVDSGRHAAHTRRILDFAAATGTPIRALINTHWHLDHVGGNGAIRRAHPGVRVYASGAIAVAMKGFLATYRSQLEAMIAEAAGDEAKRKPLRAELAILDSGPALFPDESIRGAGEVRIAGKRLMLGLETDAVTGGDVWVLDRESGVLVSGDLITLPAPFFDTACAARWKESLETIARAEFTMLVPGHGAPMSRAAVDAYRAAFDGLLACGASSSAKGDCIAGWVRDAGSLIEKGDERLAEGLIDYYVDNHLRGDPARNAKLCGEGE